VTARLTALVVGVALCATACGGGGKSAAPTQAPAPAATTAPAASTAPATPSAVPAHRNVCLNVPPNVVAKIMRHVVLLGGKLNHPQAYATSAFPVYFVSAVVTGGGAKNAVATWATPTLDAKGPIWAVDANAALISEYGAIMSKIPRLHASVSAVQKSRVCSAGAGAPLGLDAPVGNGGGGAPAGG
jgi:hypothetical protein